MLLGFLKGGKRYFILAVAASAVSILSNFLMPQIVGFTVDSVLGGKEATLPAAVSALIDRLGGVGFLRANLIFCAVGVTASAAVSGLFSFLSRLSLAQGTERFIKRARDTLFRHTQNLPFSWHTKNLTGDIIQRCTSDVETTRRFVSDQLIEVLRTAILLAAALAIMFTMNRLMAALVAAFIPLILFYTLYFSARVSREFRRCDEAEGDLTVAVQENLTGVRVVRAFGREKFETDRFDRYNDTLADKWIALGRTLGVYWGVGDVVSAAALLTVIAVGAYMAASGTISLGDFLIFLSYEQAVSGPVRGLGRTLSEMSKTGVSLARLLELLNAPTEPPEPGALCPPLNRDVVFNNVSFSYGDNPVLKNLSFTVRGGTTLGVLGATGSGKSTVTYLLNRLYDLPEGGGEITIGGVELRKIDRAYLRRNVGIVLQEPFLFSKTILENLGIAAAQRGDLAAAREKAKIAAVDDDIMGFKNGYDTVVGERGVTLSGGQKQRVAIARTLMLGAPIMVFDDSMSNLDMETDARIRDALRETTADATVILISHRISTLMAADNILVLSDGHVAETGTHRELLAQNGLSRRVYEIQSAAGDEGATL
jgi:ATP-binding cassette subfamily B protein